MLLGSSSVKIDEKFRLKIPANFRRELPESEDGSYFVTSEDGRCARIYPMQVWQRLSERIQQLEPVHPIRQKYERNTGYYGIVAQMDPQGRILIPQHLREDAEIAGEVVVIAKNDHLEIWNKQIFREQLKQDPITDGERRELATLLSEHR